MYENRLCFWIGHVIEERDKEVVKSILKESFSADDEDLIVNQDSEITFTTTDDNPTEVCITFRAEYIEIEANNAYVTKEIFEAIDEEVG